MTVTACIPGRRDDINMLQDKPHHHPDILHHPDIIEDNRVKDDSQSNRTLSGAVRKNNKRRTIRSPSTYHLGYFTLWWGRMEREGKKEAEERKCRTEDRAASRGMQMFLGCGKRMKDGRKIIWKVME